MFLKCGACPLEGEQFFRKVTYYNLIDHNFQNVRNLFFYVFLSETQSLQLQDRSAKLKALFSLWTSCTVSSPTSQRVTVRYWYLATLPLAFRVGFSARRVAIVISCHYTYICKVPFFAAPCYSIDWTCCCAVSVLNSRVQTLFFYNLLNFKLVDVIKSLGIH